MQSREQLGVGLQQRIQQVQQAELRLGGLGQQQQGQRAEQHGPGLDAQRPGLLVLPQRLVARQSEHRVRAELGHQVVVVRVEPLGHLERGDAVGASGHREVGIQARQPGEPLRNRAEQDRRVQHLVIPGERVRRDGGQARVPQRLPGLPAQPCPGLLQFLAADPARPPGFGGLLQFPAPADPRVPQHGRFHGRFLPRSHHHGPAEDEDAATTPLSRALPRSHGHRAPGGARAEAGLRTHGPGTFRYHLMAVASQARRPSADDGGRSRSPLRGSPGFTPGSLLRHPGRNPDEPSAAAVYADTAAWALVAGPHFGAGAVAPATSPPPRGVRGVGSGQQLTSSGFWLRSWAAGEVNSAGAARAAGRNAAARWQFWKASRTP